MTEAILPTQTQDGALHTKELCTQFLAIARKKLTGTLTVVARDGATKSFLCHNGTVADLDTGREDTLLTRVLVEYGQISGRQLKKAQKTAEKNDSSVGAVLLEMNVVPEEDLLKGIEESVTDEVTEVFDWEVEQSSFQSHEVEERVEGFESELSDYFDILADPETLFLEAAQRLERWDLVQQCFDLLLDVFYATPGTFSYFREPETYPAEIRVLGAIDGTKDVEEVVSESGLDPFTSIEVVRNLSRDGAIELINPVQLFQLGTQAVAGENLEKASRLFRRAKERGLNDFDIELRQAQALEGLGHKKEAAACYFEFSNRCLAQLRVDDALRSLRRVVKLGSDQVEVMRKLLELLIQHNRSEEALDTALSFADRLDGRGDPQGALDLLMMLREADYREVKLHEKIIALAEKCDETELAQAEKALIAQKFHDRRDTAEALEAYQNMFCEGNDSLEVRLKLVELHKDQGNRQKAIDHVNSILSLGGRRRLKDPEALLSVHQTMRELQPANVRSNRWLVDHHLENDHKEQAVEVLKAWIPELEKRAALEELVTALEQLISLEDHHQYRWTLASVLEKLDREDESRKQLRVLARQTMRKRQFQPAAKALEHILKRSPLDVETRKAQVELYELRGEKDLAAEALKELATLEIIAGRIQEAEGYCRQFLVTHPEDAEVVDKFGKLCLELGDHQKAVEQFLKAAKIHLENRNLGLAQRALNRLFKAHPQHQEGKALLARLETCEAVAATPAKAVESTPTSPALTSKREPFSGPAPVKTTVTGITARLRKLKSGDGMKGKDKQATTPVGNIAARLKSLKGAGGSLSPAAATGGDGPAASMPPAKAPEGSGTPGAVPEAPQEAGAGGVSSPVSRPPAISTHTALKSAAARLKALSSQKKPAADIDPPAPAAEAGPDAGESNPPVTPSADGEPVASPAAGENAEASGAPESGEAPGNAPTSARLQQKLGGAASRLAALRKPG
ncbi:MAG: hypothetical protein O7J95_19235 [Planctomycetota bacterium]|nr:hypothetical protein [Planctomycetota bacterium]